MADVQTPFGLDMTKGSWSPLPSSHQQQQQQQQPPKPRRKQKKQQQQQQKQQQPQQKQQQQQQQPQDDFELGSKFSFQLGERSNFLCSPSVAMAEVKYYDPNDAYAENGDADEEADNNNPSGDTTPSTATTTGSSTVFMDDIDASSSSFYDGLGLDTPPSIEDSGSFVESQPPPEDEDEEMAVDEPQQVSALGGTVQVPVLRSHHRIMPELLPPYAVYSIDALTPTELAYLKQLVCPNCSRRLRHYPPLTMAPPPPVSLEGPSQPGSEVPLSSYISNDVYQDAGQPPPAPRRRRPSRRKIAPAAANDADAAAAATPPPSSPPALLFPPLPPPMSPPLLNCPPTQSLEELQAAMLNHEEEACDDAAAAGDQDDAVVQVDLASSPSPLASPSSPEAGRPAYAEEEEQEPVSQQEEQPPILSLFMSPSSPMSNSSAMARPTSSSSSSSSSSSPPSAEIDATLDDNSDPLDKRPKKKKKSSSPEPSDSVAAATTLPPATMRQCPVPGCDLPFLSRSFEFLEHLMAHTVPRKPRSRAQSPDYCYCCMVPDCNEYQNPNLFMKFNPRTGQFKTARDRFRNHLKRHIR